MDYYIVDTFTDTLFSGNPTGICVITKPLTDKLMQQIAKENQFSETAFLEKNNIGYSLRWFTPVAEVPLCLHATLGASYVVNHFLEPNITSIHFETKSGILTVSCKENNYRITTPAFTYKPMEITTEIIEILGIQPKEGYSSRDLLFLLDSEQEVINITPNFSKMKELPNGLGVIVTAKGTKTDFVSRCFFPKLGVNEDMATGSSHCILAPFWTKRLHKNNLSALQLSPRIGQLKCETNEIDVVIEGKAVLYLKGEIPLP